MSNKKTKVVLALTTLAMSVALSACGHEHEWEEATCTTPKTCVTCDETEGEALGHEWEEATCTIGKVCSTCGETKGEPLGHKWEEATCTTAKVCNTCGETEGEALGHEWKEATCTIPKTCTVCGETDGEVAEHDLNSSGKCRVCGEKIGFALNKSNYKTYLSFKVSGSSNTVTIEPLSNVTFCNVIINVAYLDTNQKKTITPVGVNDSGYGIQDLGKIYRYSNIVVDSVSGYIIE